MAEQMRWDITTKEKALFEKALQKDDLSWEEPLIDESGGSLDTEMPDMAAELPTLEREDSPPVIDDDDGSLVSEAPIYEDEDPNEGQRQVEEPDLVTDEPREIESHQLRRRLTTKQSRKLARVSELSPERRNGIEVENTRTRLHDAFLVKFARSKAMAWPERS